MHVGSDKRPGATPAVPRDEEREARESPGGDGSRHTWLSSSSYSMRQKENSCSNVHDLLPLTFKLPIASPSNPFAGPAYITQNQTSLLSPNSARSCLVTSSSSRTYSYRETGRSIEQHPNLPSLGQSLFCFRRSDSKQPLPDSLLERDTSSSATHPRAQHIVDDDQLTISRRCRPSDSLDSSGTSGVARYAYVGSRVSNTRSNGENTLLADS